MKRREGKQVLDEEIKGRQVCGHLFPYVGTGEGHTKRNDAKSRGERLFQKRVLGN